MGDSGQTTQHDAAFAEAKEVAVIRYSGQSVEHLRREQSRLRAEYTDKGPLHSLVARLEVIHALLK